MHEWIQFPLLRQGVQAHLYPALQRLTDASAQCKLLLFP